MARKPNVKDKTSEVSTENTDIKPELQPHKEADITHEILREGKALKLSPKSTNHVFYEIAIHNEENELYIRMSGNEGGGLHSKEWVPLKDIFAVLDVQGDKPFKSSALKCVFSGQSANNAGFMCGVCREMGLIIKSEKSVFLHVLAPDYEQRRDELLSLVVGGPKPE